METLIQRHLLLSKLEHLRASGKSIGFVPTMGALHQGHIALVLKAKSENDVVVVSIFVNPTQFNNNNDLLHYPRTVESDRELLENVACDLLFLPDVSEMYPDGLVEPVTEIDLAGLDVVMEGAHRPGHFLGVIQVVKKLFDSIGICKAYFGEKDFQQLAVIKKMVKEWSVSVEIIACPIVREADGLAMSSRNIRLTKEERKVATQISKALFHAKEMWSKCSLEEIKKNVTTLINSNPEFQLEYFEIADTISLKPLTNNEKKNAVACIAVHLGAVRLIDNIILG